MVLKAAWDGRKSIAIRLCSWFFLFRSLSCLCDWLPSFGPRSSSGCSVFSAGRWFSAFECAPLVCNFSPSFRHCPTWSWNFTTAMKFLSILPALPYLVVEFHYGNVQFFIFALVAAALLCLDEWPVLAAFALALAISVKVWPLFFVPYLMVRRRLAVASLALAFSAGLTLLPASYFGWHTNASLLHQWANQELAIATTAGEPVVIEFPSQSLHSMLMRFLVSLNYARLTDSNYP